MIAPDSPRRRHLKLHPVVIMLVMLLAAVALTHIVPAGRFDRHNGDVIPGTYRTIDKINGLSAVVSESSPTIKDEPARAAGIASLLGAIPKGMVKQASLIVMVMFVGGMFGILRTTGAIDAAIDRMLHLTTGNVYLLSGGLMFLLAAGATFLGFISEYLAIMPLVLILGDKMKLPSMFGPAIVCVSSMIGYAASVTNPIVLAVAQPLAGVPVFSGILPRLLIFTAMFSVGVAYVMLYLRKLPRTDHIPEASRLSISHTAVLLSVLLGGLALVVGTAAWEWGTSEHAAAFVGIGALLAVAGRLGPAAATDAFLDGMRQMLLPGVMIGLAGAMDIILRTSQILDSVVYGFAVMIEGQTPGFIASGIMGAEMLFDVLIHSTSAKAAISLPVLTPIAQLAGVSGQVAVTALTLGGGLTNMVTPTNGLLLAFLAAAKVDYLAWLRFVAPLFGILCVIGVVALYCMTALGI